MKKKILTWMLLLTMGSVMLSGCGDEKETIQNISKVIETEQESSGQDAQEESATETVSEVTTEITSETVSEPEPEPEIIQITINAVGDITLGSNHKHNYKNSFHEYYDKNGYEYFLKNVKDIFEADDFTIGNLEGTLTESDNRMDKLWNHKGKPEYIKILSEFSVEALALGNNHIMDYNQEGADDTIKYVSEAGIEYALSGEWGNHYGLYETEKGITIGFVSVNEHYDEEACYPMLEDGYAYLEEAGADLIIAYIHWGGDKQYDLEPEQYIMGKWCIDRGYDVVFGAHSHYLQSIEYYKGKYIAHCMGNFCYGGNRNPDDKRTMIWQQTFTFIDGVLQEDSDVTIIPCRVSSVTDRNDFCPVVLEGEEAKEVIAHINERSEEFGVRFDEAGKHIREDINEEAGGN